MVNVYLIIEYCIIGGSNNDNRNSLWLNGNERENEWFEEKDSVKIK
jgi:hypothetical protein